MNNKQRDAYHRQLREQLDTLRARLNEIHNELAGQTKSTDQLDQSQNNEIRAKLRHEKSLIEARIRAHVQALNHFEEFGFCQDCGDDIPEQRLAFDPCITTCVRCQEKREPAVG